MFKFFWQKRRDRGGKGRAEATKVDVQLSVAPTGGGDYLHRFKGGEQVNAAGDFDFSDIEGPVAVTIRIEGECEPGIVFSGPAANAIALVPEKLAERGKCPAAGAVTCDQFSGFELSKDGLALTFFDANSDHAVYLYALRFLNAMGCAHVYDPKIKNGGDHV